MTRAGSWALPARAKLNLGLAIVGRRADGYHLLDTVFHPLALHDDVALALAGDGVQWTITAAEPELLVPCGPDNLVHRAVVAFAAAVGYRGGFHGALHKRIPHGGGLGGGSSDAAAALRLANWLLGAPLDLGALDAVALRLGADVPFFLRAGSHRGQGIGDQLTPVSIRPRHFVLVVPPYGCPTVEVYKSFAALWKCAPATDTVRPIPVPDTTDALLRIGFHNDLQPAAERVRPELAGLRLRIAELQSRPVAMTGSGSTLFVPCADATDAQLCVHELSPLRSSGVRLVATHSATDGIDEPRPWEAAVLPRSR
ncbi:MAG: 4-(cytidine 5'-diphospho)-2-C-methyl-D-erythritol kinase [Planctomycetes bacterium]|nr:4-(cytidine 5'-diphospho)-2-C-methyl-D-erythritol kinase [Planctomycetota bacterium]